MNLEKYDCEIIADDDSRECHLIDFDSDYIDNPSEYIGKILKILLCDIETNSDYYFIRGIDNAFYPDGNWGYAGQFMFSYIPNYVDSKNKSLSGILLAVLE